MIYYRHSNEDGHISFVMISECLQHDTIAVFTFQTKLIAFLKQALPFDLKKIIYFSDEAASQYKNRKNFLICAIINWTLASKQNGISQRPLMAKELVMVWEGPSSTWQLEQAFNGQIMTLMTGVTLH